MSTIARTTDNQQPRHELIIELAQTTFARFRAAIQAEDMTGPIPPRVTAALAASRALGMDLEALGLRGRMPTLAATQDAIRDLPTRWYELTRPDRAELNRCLADFLTAMARAGYVTEVTK